MLIVFLVVATLAVTRLTRLLVDDQLTNGYRRWVVKKWGEDSMASYLAHCPWCTSVWLAALILPPTVVLAAPVGTPWHLIVLLGLLSVPAASLVAGLLLDGKE